MNQLIAAFQFLTILPVGRSECFEPKQFIPYFPVVGVVLGGLLALSDMLALLVFPKPAASLLDVIFLIVVTGALHIDGLADTADGMYGARPKEKALAIMKDSRIGSIGATAIICVLAVKWSGIYSLHQDRLLCLIIIPAYARTGMLFGMKFLTYGRQSEGLGYSFFQTPLTVTDFFWFLIPVSLSFFMGFRAILLNFTFCLFTAFILIFYYKRLGCITGDMLGAANELLEAGLFLVCSIGGGAI